MLRMYEGRKRVLLIAAAILAARKLSGFDGGKRVPATVAAITDAVRWGEAILNEIDERWPSPGLHRNQKCGDNAAEGEIP
jgi:hypothetical protein